MRTSMSIGLLLPVLAGCATVAPKSPPARTACIQSGEASWYFAGNHRGADGEKLRPGGLFAAHPSLPFGTEVLVTELESGRSVKVRISDRGPFVKGRIIDLSPAAAERLGIKHDGVAEVSLRPVDPNARACPFEAA